MTVHSGTQTRNPNLDAHMSFESRLSAANRNWKVPKGDAWWTAMVPQRAPGWNDNREQLESLQIPNLNTCTRLEVGRYFQNSWVLTELLFSSLLGADPAEAFLRPPYHGLRHPMIFYYAHPAVLYVNKLRVAGLLSAAVNPEFEQLFETGVDEMSWDDLSKNEMQWPSLELVHAYRSKVYALVSSLIEDHPDLHDGHPPITMEHPLWALFMGFEHERIHLETSSVLIRELPLRLVHEPIGWPKVAESDDADTRASLPIMSKIASQANVLIGKPRSFPTYGWDNEYGERRTDVDAFHVSQDLITNAQFLEFVKAGGYQNESLWTAEGWRWRSFRNVKAPTFWVPSGPQGTHQYSLRTLFAVREMPKRWPVVVNFHEAKAYANWLTREMQKIDKDAQPFRLPSEAQYHAIERSSVADVPKVADQFNLGFRFSSESRVGQSDSESVAVRDLRGNVWQWCEDHFHPLPGFKVHRLYDDFSTPCFDGKHQLIWGGSFASTGDEATPHARFHFRAHFFQHSGFRLVQSANFDDVVKIGNDTSDANIYESRKYLSEYMLLHYGGPEEVQLSKAVSLESALRFPTRVAGLTIATALKNGISKSDGSRALDIGCAVGGTVFELAKHFGHVTGVDLSESFVRVGQEIATHGFKEYEYKVEGDIYQRARVEISDRARLSRCEFRQADACSLPPEFVGFDAVVMSNLLCRLPSPKSCLARMSGARGVVRLGGVLVILSPFTWLEEFSPKEVWLGGFEENGVQKWSRDGLVEQLNADFELQDEFDMPLLIREHRRRFQLIVSLATVWKRRS